MSATEKYLHLALSLLLIFSFSQMKSWTENSVRIANSLKARPLLRVIRFYFGKSSVQRVFLALGSSYLIKLLEMKTTKCITSGADQNFGKQPDKLTRNK